MASDLVIDTTALPDAFVGVPYSASVAYHANATVLIPADSLLTGVSDPEGGATLPAGLAIGTTAATQSTISGTPTGAGAGPGVYTFTVKLQDTAGAVTSGDITLALHSADIQDGGGYATEQADAALSLSADLNDREWPAIPS